MAEMLIRLHPQASGDIIAVRPDGWSWGNKEILPNFNIIYFDDVDYKDMTPYEQPASGTVSGIFYKHQWKIDLASMSSGVLNKTLSSTKLVVGSGVSKSGDITWNGFRKSVYDKLNMVNEETNNKSLPTKTDKNPGSGSK